MPPRSWRGVRAVAALLLASAGGVALLAYCLGERREPDAQAPTNFERASRAREAFERAEFPLHRRGPGDLVLSQKYFDAALVLDPGMAQAWAGLAGVRFVRTVSGDTPPQQGLALVRDAAERALALDPRVAEAHVRLAQYLSLSDNPDGARRHAESARALALVEDWPDEVVRTQVLALAYHALERAAEADAALRRLIEYSAEQDPVVVAEVYAFRGERDRAFEWPRAGVPGGGTKPWERPHGRPAWMTSRSPLLMPLHVDPRWNAWVASVRPAPTPGRSGQEVG